MARGSGVVAICLALLGSVHHAESALAYAKSGSGNLCAGIEIPCTDYATCTKLVVGPCMSAEEGPTLKFVGLAFVNSTSNYNNAVNAQVVLPWTPTTSGQVNGYRKDQPTSLALSPSVFQLWFAQYISCLWFKKNENAFGQSGIKLDYGLRF